MVAIRLPALLLGAASTSALMVPSRAVKTSTLRFVEVAERIQTSEEAPARDAEYLKIMDEFTSGTAEPANNIIASPFDAEAPDFEQIVDQAMQEHKDGAVAPAIETAAAPREEVEVGAVGEFLIKWGFKDDPRIPDDERVDAMTRIKNSGRAGIVAYALTEGAFWIGSVPFAIAAITIATGTLPVMGSVEGKEAIAADAFVFINFARLIVPARIAFALGLAPWCDENIVQKYFPDEKADENKE